MNRKRYQQILKEEKITPPRIKNAFNAFLMGGTLGVIAQLTYELFRMTFDKADASSLTYLVFLGLAAILTGIGVFDNIAQIFGAGVFIPITGFANSLVSEAIESKSEGLIYGLGANIFKLAGTVIAYGILSSFVLASLYHIVVTLI